MTHAFRIRTIFLAAPEPDDTTGRTFIDSAQLHVGDNTDPTKNPTCGGKVYDSGVYECNLVGKFVGISRVCSNLVPLGLVELLAFNTILLEGKVSPHNGTYMTSIPQTDPCDPIKDSS
jgi:hypothetical protein